MYPLKEIFTNSKYDLKIFLPNEIKAIEEKIFLKKIRDKEYPYIKCLKRDKEIRLTPEEAVRQLYLYRLINRYGYSLSQIALEHPIQFGREKKRADIVIFENEDSTSEYIIVEVKKPKLEDGKEQLRSYCYATNALIGVWTNGEKINHYIRKQSTDDKGKNIREKILFVSLDDLPTATQDLEEILKDPKTIQYLIDHDVLLKERKTLSELIKEIENEVLANSGEDVFEEVFKLIYTKLYDEMQCTRDKTRILEFRNYGGTDKKLKEHIQKLFKKAKEKWIGVFKKDDEIELTAAHLSVCVSTLQNVKLFNSNLEIIDDAFEYLMNKTQKGEKGQYFTPRYVIDMCVKMLNPKKNESMIDTAAGSCGFPMHTTFYVWKSILKELGKNQSHLFTAENKLPECEEYVTQKIFAIDFDNKAVRIARTLNLIAGDGKTNVLKLNTLDYGGWQEVIKEQRWIDNYNEGWKKLRELRRNEDDNRDFDFDILMANPPFAGDVKEVKIISKYELGERFRKKSDNPDEEEEIEYYSKIGRDILFIERNLQFLKPGGRMAIVLPQGRFNNSSDKYIRDFIAERCRILAVVGLHGNVFKPHTGTKTSVLFVQKWHDKLCPRREDYPIFFATMQKPSKDNSGEKIFVTNEDGTNKLDSHGHLIVDHDLFNHEGLTQDGIAEAFIEFAKREKLSFFESSSFDEVKYKNLLEELEISEVNFSIIELNNRYDAEFYFKKDINKFKFLLKFDCKKISDIAFTTDGEHGSPEWDEKSNIKYITAEYIKPNEIIDAPMKTISFTQDEKNSRCRLQKGDVLIYSVGAYAGYACCAEPHLFPANIPRSVGLIRLKDLNFTAGFLSIFLNSKFGVFQSIRLRAGNAQPVLAIENFNRLIVPKLDINFQIKIDKIYHLAYENRMQAKNLYQSAEKILIHSLGLENFSPSTQNISIKSFSDSFIKSGRLDAEYYQAKYEDYKNLIHSNETVSSICNVYDENFNPREGKIYNYIELADVGAFGNITNTEKIIGVDLPSRARRLINAGQVIISSIEGSLEKSALITDEYDGAICSTGFYVIDSNKINSETLLILFKSKLMQMLMKQSCSGTILTAISKNEFLNLPLPLIDKEIQEKISSQIKKSFALRRESEKLLEEAKILVENAIEHGEK